MSKKQDRQKLDYWQGRVTKAKSLWATEQEAMDRRENQYSGAREVRKLIDNDQKKQSQHVYNITAENIESIVDSNIPKPKVTPRRKEDERLARIIEHMLMNELDRLRMEEINDQQERTCPIQGGTIFLCEWDEGECGADHAGEVQVTACHPKMLLPQPGVYTGIEDMDYVGLLVPDTKENVKRRYGIDVSMEQETDPDVKTIGGDTAEDMVTRTVIYYRNGDSIGKFHYVGDTVLEDLDDCQARRKRRCAKCGALENTEALILSRPTMDGSYPEGAETEQKAEKGACPYCGSTKWNDSKEEYMELLTPVSIGGMMYGGQAQEMDEYGNVVAVATERIPYYNPRVFPIILQKNVSKFGQLLGDSDVDKIADQQNTVNRMEQKIIDKLLSAGSKVSLPPDTKITIDPKDMSVWRLESPEAKQYIGVYNLEGDVSQDLAYLAQVYQESRNILGITDSYQGRADSTATSGKAKQFSAAQSAGRMESKRVLKNAAYAKLFELIFKLKLAYCDEPRPVFYKDSHGENQYEEFNKMDFLKRVGEEWIWNTDFIFSVDDSGGLGANRSALWQELTAQLQAGALGNPAELDTLIDYWAAMEELHYPTAGQIRTKLMQRKQEQQMQAQLAMMQSQQMKQPMMQQPMV